MLRDTDLLQEVSQLTMDLVSCLISVLWTMRLQTTQIHLGKESKVFPLYIVTRMQ